MSSMKNALKSLFKPAPLLVAAAFIVVLLSFLIANSFQSSISGQAQYWLIIATVIGISILVCLVLVNLIILLRQYRRGKIGSRLSLRLIGMFVVLNLLPLFMVYFFAVQFLNKGIDSWFDVRVEQAIDDAVLLGQTSLEAVTQDMIKEMNVHSESVANLFSQAEISGTLNEIAEQSGYSKVSLISNNGQIIASSFDSFNNLLDYVPNSLALTQVKLGQTFSTIEQVGENTQQLKVTTPVLSNNFGIPSRALQATKPLPLRYARLAKTVESAKTQYDQMLFAREPLKLSLILTLTLISLASLLLSNLASFYLARRITKPLSILARGTKDVAAGNFDTQLPVPSKDEIGILVSSFNDMTQQLSHAHTLADKSKTETEEQKKYLEMVLSNLSSGVMSINDKHCLERCNPIAGSMLNLDLDADIGMSLTALSEKYENLSAFFSNIGQASIDGKETWQDEQTILGLKGQQVLIIHGTQLPLKKQSTVVVLDDVTSLIKAQKDSAWGEVARRLAHEIKNPLTPIQLSAERIQNKFSNEIDEELKPALTKSTRTIVQQVEALKNMVSAFSDYAQAINTKKVPVNLHQLLSDIADLHKNTSPNCQLVLSFDDSIETINSDENALRQIFNNIILNAIQAMQDDENSALSISTEITHKLNQNTVTIKVSDTGQGIHPELTDSLFEPYISSKPKGSGLGLAIVKRLVGDLGGEVWYENNSPTGSIFIINLYSENNEATHS